MRIHTTCLKSGITRTPEFERKGLASFAVNIGTKCGHGCAYCSTGAMLRMHQSFKDAHENPFGFGYAIVDPSTPQRVARDARLLRRRGLIQLCTTVDAWAPEAKQYDLGRRCLEAILEEPGWTVRILTKNASVAEDFDLIQKYRDRVLVGLSLTASPSEEGPMRAVEPNASTLKERTMVMEEAGRLGLRVYGMYCPLLPGIADSAAAVEQLVEAGIRSGVEEVFVEPVNARGPGLRSTEIALKRAGFTREAQAITKIRHQEAWSAYVVQMLDRVQNALRRHTALDKLHFLLYPSRLLARDLEWMRSHSEGVRWLGKEDLSRPDADVTLSGKGML